MVWDNFQAIIGSAGGMDGWEPIELKFLSYHMCEWIPTFYQLIQRGADWPPSTRHAEIAYLKKRKRVWGSHAILTADDNGGTLQEMGDSVAIIYGWVD